MEKLRKMTVDGIEYNLLTDADIEEIKLVSRLETLASDIESGQVKTIPGEVYRRRLKKSLKKISCYIRICLNLQKVVNQSEHLQSKTI